MSRARVLAEIDALDTSAAAELATAHAAAVTTGHGVKQVRRYQCPLCMVAVDQREHPKGWLIVEPFTRVAACAVCRPEIQARHS